jgi:hypothetical protein
MEIMSKQIIEREISAQFVDEHGGLIDGMPPGIHEEAYMADSYKVLSVEPMVHKFGYKVTYEIENHE